MSCKNAGHAPEWKSSISRRLAAVMMMVVVMMVMGKRLGRYGRDGENSDSGKG